MAKDLGITILLDFYGDMLTEKQRDFLGYYYNDDLSLSEIAENEGITRQGVRDSIKRAEAQLFDMEERLGGRRRARRLRAVFMKCAEGSMKSSTARIRSASTICDMAYPGKSTIRL